MGRKRRRVNLFLLNQSVFSPFSHWLNEWKKMRKEGSRERIKMLQAVSLRKKKQDQGIGDFFIFLHSITSEERKKIKSSSPPLIIIFRTTDQWMNKMRKNVDFLSWFSLDWSGQLKVRIVTSVIFLSLNWFVFSFCLKNYFNNKLIQINFFSSSLFCQTRKNEHFPQVYKQIDLKQRNGRNRKNFPERKRGETVNDDKRMGSKNSLSTNGIKLTAEEGGRSWRWGRDQGWCVCIITFSCYSPRSDDNELQKKGFKKTTPLTWCFSSLTWCFSSLTWYFSFFVTQDVCPSLPFLNFFSLWKSSGESKEGNFQ